MCCTRLRCRDNLVSPWGRIGNNSAARYQSIATSVSSLVGNTRPCVPRIRSLFSSTILAIFILANAVPYRGSRLLLAGALGAISPSCCCCGRKGRREQIPHFSVRGAVWRDVPLLFDRRHHSQRLHPNARGPTANDDSGQSVHALPWSGTGFDGRAEDQEAMKRPTPKREIRVPNATNQDLAKGELTAAFRS